MNAWAGPARLPGMARRGWLIDWCKATTCSRVAGNPFSLSSMVNTGDRRLLARIEAEFLGHVVLVDVGDPELEQLGVDHHVVPAHVALADDDLEGRRPARGLRVLVRDH